MVDTRLRIPRLFCESDDIVVVYNSTDKSSIGFWRWKMVNWRPVNDISYTTSSDGIHWTAAVTQKQLSKQRRSWSPSEQWFDTCLDNQVFVVFCVSLTWLCETQLSAVVCFVCCILDLLTVFCSISWVTVWTFLLNLLATWIHVALYSDRVRSGIVPPPQHPMIMG